jgi:hypothetical protein
MGVEYTHYEDECTFDYFIKKHKLNDPALKTLEMEKLPRMGR